MRWRRRDAREQHLPLRAANKPPHEANLRRLSQFPSPPRVVFPYFSAQPETRRKVSILLSPPGCRQDNANFPWAFTTTLGEKEGARGCAGTHSGEHPTHFGAKNPTTPGTPPLSPPSTALPGAAACLRAMEKGGGKRKVCPPRGRRHSPPWPRRCPG